MPTSRSCAGPGRSRGESPTPCREIHSILGWEAADPVGTERGVAPDRRHVLDQWGEPAALPQPVRSKGRQHPADRGHHATIPDQPIVEGDGVHPDQGAHAGIVQGRSKEGGRLIENREFFASATIRVVECARAGPKGHRRKGRPACHIRQSFFDGRNFVVDRDPNVKGPELVGQRPQPLSRGARSPRLCGAIGLTTRGPSVSCDGSMRYIN